MSPSVIDFNLGQRPRTTVRTSNSLCAGAGAESESSSMRGQRSMSISHSRLGSRSILGWPPLSHSNERDLTDNENCFRSEKLKSSLEGFNGLVPIVELIPLRCGHDVRNETQSSSEGISQPSHANASNDRKLGHTLARRFTTRLSSISSPGAVHSKALGQTARRRTC